jgi:hypothetical protein
MIVSEELKKSAEKLAVESLPPTEQPIEITKENTVKIETQPLEPVSTENCKPIESIEEESFVNEMKDVVEDNEISCGCTEEEHLGKKQLDITLNFPVHYLYECLIEGNDVKIEFHKKRKISGKHTLYKLNNCSSFYMSLDS